MRGPEAQRARRCKGADGQERADLVRARLCKDEGAAHQHQPEGGAAQRFCAIEAPGGGRGEGEGQNAFSRCLASEIGVMARM